jgi:hypothetical protein
MSHMPRLLIASFLTVLVLCRPAPASATQSPAAEAGMGLAAAGLNLVYLPAKVIVAIGGGAVGGVVGLLTGGDVRAAYGIWVPTGSGSYFVRPAHLEGTEQLEFFGSDYADRPSPQRGTEGYTFYEAMYESK